LPSPDANVSAFCGDVKNSLEGGPFARGPFNGCIDDRPGDVDWGAAGDGDLVGRDRGVAVVLLSVEPGREGERAGMVGVRPEDDDLGGVAYEHLVGEGGGLAVRPGGGVAGGDGRTIEVEGVGVVGVRIVAGKGEVQVGERLVELVLGPSMPRTSWSALT